MVFSEFKKLFRVRALNKSMYNQLRWIYLW